MLTLKNSTIKTGKLTLIIGASATIIQFSTSLLLVNFFNQDATSAFLFGALIAISAKLIILSEVFKIKSKIKDQLIYAFSSFLLIVLFNSISNEFSFISNTNLVVIFCALSSFISFMLSFFLNKFISNRSLS